MDPSGTVKTVMDAIAAAQPGFSYTPTTLPGNNKEIVDTISYQYGQNAQQPPNSSVPV